MITDDELSDGMRNLASDSPAEAEVAATVRARINGNHKVQRTVLASVAAVAAVAVIVTTASLLRSPAQHDQIQPVSPPQVGASSAPVSASAPAIPTSSAPATTPPASNAPATTPLTSTADPAVTGFSARCYTTADLNRTDNHLAVSLNAPVGPHAMEICQQNWENGTLFAAAPFIRDQPAGPGQSVPDLVACVLPADMSDEGTEEVAIFPGSDDTCGKLNLPRYTG